MAEPSSTPPLGYDEQEAPPPRTLGRYALLLAGWTLALGSWLLWMALILFFISRIFGARE